MNQRMESSTLLDLTNQQAKPTRQKQLLVFREQAKQQIKRIIEPSLKEMQCTLISQGHQSQVRLLIDQAKFPGIEISYQPKHNEANPHTNLASTLCFRTTCSHDVIYASSIVWDRDGQMVDPVPKESAEIFIDDLNPGWVKRLTYLFVRAVQDSY